MAITYQKRTFFNSGGTPPFTTTAYTPNAGGNYLGFLNVTGDGVNENIQMSSSAGGTYTSEVTYNDSSSRTWAFINTVACVAGSQTFTVTENSTGFVSIVIGWEYSGVGTVSNCQHTDNTDPGTGTGAIVGAAIVVPSGSVLVACCVDLVGSETITATAGTQRDSEPFNPSFQLVDYAGTGSSITPAFTTSTNGANDYGVWQMILNPPVVATYPLPSQIYIMP